MSEQGGYMVRGMRVAFYMAALLAAGAVAGCGVFEPISKDPLFDPTRVARSDLAGSTQVSIESEARWEHYQDAVQPAFALTADQALAEALPDESAIQSEAISSLGVQSSYGTTTQPSAPSGSLAPTAAPILNLANISQDPMLRYWAATALFEEVQIINKYVHDAAVAGRYYPYLIRMQVTLLPNRRDLPYDTYTSVSFFNDKFADYAPVRCFMRTEDVHRIICNVFDQLKREALASGNQPSAIHPGIINPKLLRERIMEAIQDVTVEQDSDPTLGYKSPDGKPRCWEALPLDAVMDGLKVAWGTGRQRRPTDRDLMQAALAYARDRSARFVAFRGFDPSEYVDAVRASLIAPRRPADLEPDIESLSTDTEPPQNPMASIRNDLSHEREFNDTTFRKTVATAIGREEMSSNNSLVSVTDFELSMNEMAQKLDSLSADVGADSNPDINMQEAIISCLTEQSQHGSNYRPLVSDPSPENPVVLPLLVTDDIQSAIESRSLEQVRQLAISLAAAAGTANAGGGIASLENNLRTALGRSLDSAFTISRSADNMICARFGAAFQAGSQYGMVPEAHNVTLLVLVPKLYCDSVRGPKLHMSTYTEFVDAETGNALQSSYDTDQFERDIANLLPEYTGYYPPPGRSKVVDEIAMDVLDDNFEDFQRLAGGPANYLELLWTRILNLRRKMTDGYLDAELSNPVVPGLANDEPSENPAAIDDGKKSTTVFVRGSGDLFPSRISAELLVSPPAPAPAEIKISTTTNQPNDFILSTTDKPLSASVSATQPVTIQMQPTTKEPTQMLISSGTAGKVDFASNQPAKLYLGSSGQPISVSDGKGSLTVTTAQPSQLSLMQFPADQMNDTSKAVFEMSAPVAVLSDNRTIQFTFPSLTACGLATPGKAPQLSLKVHFFSSDGWEAPPSSRSERILKYVLQKPPSLVVTLSAHSKVIDAKEDGSGQVIVTVGSYTPPAPNDSTLTYLTVDGADVTTATQYDSTGTATALPADATNKEAGKFPIKNNGDIQLILANLNPMANVSISAEDSNGTKLATPLTYTVDRQARVAGARSSP